MTVNLHVRNVPEEVHERLIRRAERKGMSLRQYTIDVLAEHCALPTLDDWLEEFHRLAPARTSVSGAEAVEASREDDDLSVLHGRAGS